MKCSNCQTENPTDAKFCRNCGNSLSTRTVLERYPEYNFTPTALFRFNGHIFEKILFTIFNVFAFALFTGTLIFAPDLYGYTIWKYQEPSIYVPTPINVIAITFIIAFSYALIINLCSKAKVWVKLLSTYNFTVIPVLFALNAIRSFNEYGIGSEEYFAIAGIGIFMILTPIIFLKWRFTTLLYPGKVIYDDLARRVDYIEKSSSRYVFFIKDEKWGVYDKRKYKVQINNTCDFMEWREYGKLLNVKKDGRTLTVDIYGNILK